MVSSSTVPWYNVPAREFPAKKWLGTKYPFYVPPSIFARYRRPARMPAASAAARRFPALVWREQQRL